MNPYLNVIVNFFHKNDGGRDNVYLGDYLYNDRFLNGYRPHFRVIGDDEYLGIQFLSGPEGLIMPNEDIHARVSLNTI